MSEIKPMNHLSSNKFTELTAKYLTPELQPSNSYLHYMNKDSLFIPNIATF
jgi:hypothetical protein